MKRTLTLLAVFFTILCFSQKEFYGKAVYHSKTSFDEEEFNKRKIPEDRREQIKKRIKSSLDKTFVLNFNKTESIYKEQEKLETPNSNTGRGFRFGSFSGGILYKNTLEKRVLEQKEFFGKKFLVEEENPELPEWEMTAETKQIGNYLCYKATMIKKNNALDWRNFRRPPRDENNKEKDSIKKPEKPKAPITVTAWYTPQIPVSNGPNSYWGLPGLILEASFDRTTILCTEIVLNPKEKIEIKAPKKGEKVTPEEYAEIIKAKMKEMREMRGARRGNRP